MNDCAILVEDILWMDIKAKKSARSEGGDCQKRVEPQAILDALGV